MLGMNDNTLGWRSCQWSLTKCGEDDTPLVISEDLIEVVAGFDLSEGESPQVLRELEPEHLRLVFGESVAGPGRSGDDGGRT